MKKISFPVVERLLWALALHLAIRDLSEMQWAAAAPLGLGQGCYSSDFLLQLIWKTKIHWNPSVVVQQCLAEDSVGSGSLGKAVVFGAHLSSWWESTVGGDPPALWNYCSATSEERKIDETTTFLRVTAWFWSILCMFAFLICDICLCCAGYCLHSFLVVARFRLGFGSWWCEDDFYLQRCVSSCYFPIIQT